MYNFITDLCDDDILIESMHVIPSSPASLRYRVWEAVPGAAGIPCEPASSSDLDIPVIPV